MRRIALVNQKGGVGKTTTAVNLGAALAERGRRVVLVDLDPQANLTVHLGLDLESNTPSSPPSSYRVLVGEASFDESVLPTSTPGLSVVPTDLDLSGAELELAGHFGRETLLREAVEAWVEKSREETGEDPADYLLLDCPPSLGLLSVNALAAADEVFITLQTEFFALRGLSKLVEIVDLVQKRIHPELAITGIVPCLYDSRLRLAREVLAEIQRHFPGVVFRRGIGVNVKLAEAPSYGKTILEYAPESPGARDYRLLAEEVLAMEPAPIAPENEASEPRKELVPEPPPTKDPAPRVEAPEAPQAPGTPDTPAATPDAAAPAAKSE